MNTSRAQGIAGTLGTSSFLLFGRAALKVWSWVSVTRDLLDMQTLNFIPRVMRQKL